MRDAAIQEFTITRTAGDPRADDAKRTVQVSATHVTIDRVLQGVRMRISVPVASYRDLVISIRLPSGNGTLALRHADPDLDVTLANGEAMEGARHARAWGALFQRPIAVEEAFVVMKQTLPRRRRRATKPVRAARRRWTRLGETREASFAGEHEIIART